MAYLKELESIAQTNELHDGHIARSILKIICQTKDGLIHPGKAKIMIKSFMIPYDGSNNLTNKKQLFDLISNITKSDIISL